MLRLKWILGVAASVILDIPTGYGEAVIDSINLTLLGLCAPSGNVTRLRKLRFFQRQMKKIDDEFIEPEDGVNVSFFL